MKQIQISYENREEFGRRLAEIKDMYKGVSANDIIFYITWMERSEENIPAVAEEIEKAFPDAAYYGNEASGSIAMGKMSYNINITCSIFEGSTSRTELVWVEEGTELSSLEDLWKYCTEKKDLRAVELIPSIAYLEKLQIDGNLPGIDRDILIFGGASVNYDDATFDADIIAKGHPMTRDGMAVMLYYGSDLHFESSNILGWKGLGKTMTVSSSTGKVIKEIDNIPAYEVYEKYLDLSVEDSDSLVFPLIVEEDGNEFIRTPQIIESDKSMRMFANIPEGTKVRVAYGDKNTILNSLYDEAVRIAGYRPEAIKAFSCAARRLFWGDDEVGRETVPLQGIAPVCGFYTGGEILRFGEKLRVLNQTLAIVCIREGEGNGRPAEITRQNNDISLISRITHFAEKVVEEEREQRILAEGFESAFSAQYQVMYYINLAEGKAIMLHGDEAAKKFIPIISTDSAEAMLDNFHRLYVDTIVDENDRERVKSVMNAENMNRVLKDKPSLSVNYRARRNLVDYVYTEMRIIKVGEENGKLTAVILGFKLTDEELLNALEVKTRLEEDARIIGALSENLSTVAYISVHDNKLDDNVTEIRTSELQKRIIPGLEKEPSMSKRIDMIGNILVYEPDRKKYHEDTRRERITEELLKANNYYINTRFVIDGEIRFYQVQFGAVRENDKVVGLVAGIRSVDEQTRKELEAQKRLEEALEGAEVANRSKSNFLFNMSHDIRTPMNAIRGFTAMAKKYSDDTEKVKDYLDKIDISGQQLLTLINQVLEMSRIESGKIEFDEKPVNVKERFSSMITVVEAQAKAKGLNFCYDISDIEHNFVIADDSRMGQITINVVGNAIKFTPEGGRIDFILKEIPARKPGCATFVYTVADTGIGMSEEFLSQLFEPFAREQSSTVSKIQGTGLGMSIVKELVDLKGGDIEVNSEPGKGTRFDITMDFEIADESEEAEKPSEQVRPDAFCGRRVLLVEDNEMNREIAKDILSEYGFIVEEADDGDLAVDMVGKHLVSGETGYYDFILMDIQMPRMNGYDATKAIRAIPQAADCRIPIIAMTANAFEEDRQNALAAGMDEHLAKPVDIRKLVETLSRFL